MIVLGAAAADITNGGQTALNLLNAIPQYANEGVSWGIRGLMLSFGIIGAASLVGYIVKLIKE